MQCVFIVVLYCCGQEMPPVAGCVAADLLLNHSIAKRMFKVVHYGFFVFIKPPSLLSSRGSREVPSTEPNVYVFSFLKSLALMLLPQQIKLHSPPPTPL